MAKGRNWQILLINCGAGREGIKMFVHFWATPEADLDPQLGVQSIRTGTRIMVRVSGDAGLANVSRLEAELTSVAAGRSPLVVIDLTELEFIASRGMGVLMGFHRRMMLQDGKVKIVAPGGRVRDALEIARLHNVLDVYDSLGDALRE